MLSARMNLPAYLHVQSFVFTLTILSYNPYAYNINWRNPQVFNDPARAINKRDNYFGFSVALYAGVNDSLLLVGAPRANSSKLRIVNEPGTIFKCPMNGVCDEWVIDKSGNGPFPLNRKIYQIKDNAWIGANIAVENKTEANVVVCGPRWKIRPHFVNGICYSTFATSTDTFKKPARTILYPFSDLDDQITTFKGRDIYYHAMSEGGFSLQINSLNDSTNIVLGSPGFYFWKGIAAFVTASSHGLFWQTTIPSVARMDEFNYYGYFGYALTAGAYFKQRDIWYASSAPTGANLYGKVFVFTFPSKTNQQMSIKTMLRGRQHGEYFGAALTSCDVNNDGRDELIVGSPLWSKDMDEGRVYIFTMQQNMKFKEMRLIEGEVVAGRFGSSLMCLGDINYDGYGDIAIGAPYENDNGGAVYIYNGNGNGIPSTYSQRLVGTQFSEGMRGFGISISEPRDINRDNYPDIAVGAYLSGKVVLLKSAPVITVNVTIAYLEKIRLLRETTSFRLDLQVFYVGTYVPETLRIVKILKLDQSHGRIVYSPMSNNNSSIQGEINGIYRLPETLQKNTVSSSPLTIFLKKDIQNVIDPIEIFASIHVEDDLYETDDNSSKNALCASCVVINKFLSKTEDLIKLPFAIDCGEDNVCMSDLAVTSSTDLSDGNRYVIGSTPTITLHINIQHFGEPAYQTKLRVVTEVLSLANIPPECVEDSRTSNIFEVICDIGNPLRTNKTLTLQLDASTVTYDAKQVKIRANVSTQSEEIMLDDNSHVMTVYFDIDVDIAVVGKAQVDLYSYLHENQKKPLDNITFQHFYEIQQFGASPIEEVALTVRIPTHWRYNTGELAIVEINNTTGIMDGYQFYCSNMKQTSLFISESKVKSTDDAIASLSYIADSSARVNFSIGENASMSMPSENRMLYVNCTNAEVRCTQIDCKLGPFKNSLSVAKFLITLKLRLQNFHATLMKDKDIIYFVSEGSVTITQPYNITQSVGHKPDVALVATTFLGSPIPQRISVWIIALSVVLGIILLVVLILGLIKIGFFNRKKKMELEALKAETDKKHNVILETTSSTEALDHD